MEPHVVPDETDVRPPITHQCDGKTCNFPLVHIYNTRNKCLKCQNLVAYHAVIIHPPRQIPNSSSNNTAVHRTGEDWVHMNRTTGEVTIHTGQMNTFILPDTVKPQYYRHPMKGSDKPKWSRAMENYIGLLFQVIVYILDTDTCLFIHWN